MHAARYDRQEPDVHRGLSQALDIPDSLKALYKTVWEIKQRTLVDMAADRGAFIDQSQSFNVHMSDPNFGKLTSLHFYAWKASRHPPAATLGQISLLSCCWSATAILLACFAGWAENRHVLPPHSGRCRCDQVHG